MSTERVRCSSQELRLGPTTESPKTTKLYDRTSDQITLDEVERIAI
jgi:hypothetical protein